MRSFWWSSLEGFYGILQELTFPVSPLFLWAGVQPAPPLLYFDFLPTGFSTGLAAFCVFVSEPSIALSSYPPPPIPRPSLPLSLNLALFLCVCLFQNFLRCQNNKNNYNLVCETLQFLDCICGSTTGGLGLLGLYINEKNVALINQTVESLTEYCQGPCHDNQVSICLTMSTWV